MLQYPQTSVPGLATTFQMSSRARTCERRSHRLQGAKPICITYCGPQLEWHLVIVNPFCHLAFHLGAWLRQPVVVVAPQLSCAWFVAIWSVTDSMSRDGIEDIQIHT